MQATVTQNQELAFHPKYKGIWRARHTKTGERQIVYVMLDQTSFQPCKLVTSGCKQQKQELAPI